MAKVNLTPTFISKSLVCPEGKSKVEFCDTQFPGLYVEVRATCAGQGTYYLRYKNQRGKTKHVKLGLTTELTLAQARKAAKDMKAKVLMGDDPQSERQRKRNIPTFREYIEDKYMPYIKLRKRSWEKDASVLKCHLLPEFGDFALDEITRTQIVSFHSAVRETGLAPATCDQFVILLRRMLNLAVEWEIIDKNPASRARLFNVDNRKERYLSDEEMARLLQVLTTDNNRPVCLVLLFLLSTGARVSEALKMKWSDVDIAKRTWRIPAENSKSKKTRTVPLNDSALEVLAASKSLQVDIEEYVFISGRTGQPLTNIRNIWERLRRAAELPDFRIHDCRHNFASSLVNSGRSLYEVQHILGHHDPKVTERYAHLSTEVLQEAASSASAKIGSLNLKDVDPNALYRKSNHGNAAI